MQERLAKLAGGVAVIHVGAATETEMKEKKARVEDALHATRAAVEEGIVPGGGTALLRCLDVMQDLKLKGDEAIGAQIVVRAVEEPLRQLADNAGQEGSLVVQEVKNRKGWEGFDVRQARVRRHGQGGHHRPDQGHAFRAAERGQHRGSVADHRMPASPKCRRRTSPRRAALRAAVTAAAGWTTKTY